MGDGDGGGTGGKQGKGSASDGAGDSIQIKVGDETKNFTAEQVAQAFDKVGNLEKTVEDLSGFQKVLTTYGVGPDEYVKNSEAAFAIANSLIEQGVIDEQGNVIQKKGKEGDGKDGKSLFKFTGDDGEGSKELQTVTKALAAIASKVEEIEEGQSNIYRRNIKRDVQAIHPNLKDEDISKLLALAQHDKAKGFWDHAKVMAEGKTAKEKQGKQESAVETIKILLKAGIIPEGKIDTNKLDTLDLNALKEQDPSGGAPVYEGKKFMFKSRLRRLSGSKGVDTSKFSTPADTTHEMFQKKGG